jgi:hypothetical protein
VQQQIERLRRGLWVFRQPLTREPSVPGAPVSDLFLWRSSAEWETFFELTDIFGLFDDAEGEAARHATFCFFDNEGALFLQKRLELVPRRRQTVSVSALIEGARGGMGTFCVFHSHTPRAVTQLGSYLAERGYVSYRYRGAPLRAYVHGNLDAISLSGDNRMQLLGSGSFLPREYRLQHELDGGSSYEIAVVNPSTRAKRISCRRLSAHDGKTLDVQTVKLQPRASHLFPIRAESTTSRIIIVGRLVMPRPVVFRTSNRAMDVFHG